MKNEKVENNKIHKDTNQNRAAGMQVRSGVKAGRVTDFQKERLDSKGDRFGNDRGRF